MDHKFSVFIPFNFLKAECKTICPHATQAGGTKICFLGEQLTEHYIGLMVKQISADIKVA